MRSGLVTVCANVKLNSKANGQETILCDLLRKERRYEILEAAYFHGALHPVPAIALKLAGSVVLGRSRQFAQMAFVGFATRARRKADCS